MSLLEGCIIEPKQTGKDITLKDREIKRRKKHKQTEDNNHKQIEAFCQSSIFTLYLQGLRKTNRNKSPIKTASHFL